MEPKALHPAGQLNELLTYRVSPEDGRDIAAYNPKGAALVAAILHPELFPAGTVVTVQAHGGKNVARYQVTEGDAILLP
jgi:hypothetical protein